MPKHLKMRLLSFVSPHLFVYWIIFIASFRNGETLTSNDKVFACYYTNWSQYRKDNGTFLPEDVDPHLCTHVIFAFATIDDTTLDLAPTEWNDMHSVWSPGLYERILNLKKINTKLKILLSVGGWNMDSKLFSSVVKSSSTRGKFIQNCIKFLRQLRMDGLDLDWEYPGMRGSQKEDVEKFSKLIQEMSEAFHLEAKKTTLTRLELTAAVSAAKFIIEGSFQIEKITKFLDFIIAMTYDYHGAWEWYVAHGSPLFPGDYELGIQRYLNVNWTVNYLLQHIPPEKLIIGIPSFGRSYTLKSSTNHTGGSATIGPGSKGPFTQMEGIYAFYEVCKLEDDGGWVKTWDSQQMVPHTYKANQWIGYEDIDSVSLKALFAVRKNLRGVALWSVALDDFKGLCGRGKYPLLTSVRKVLLSSEDLIKEITDSLSNNIMGSPASVNYANEGDTTEDDEVPVPVDSTEEISTDETVRTKIRTNLPTKFSMITEDTARIKLKKKDRKVQNYRNSYQGFRKNKNSEKYSGRQEYTIPNVGAGKHTKGHVDRLPKKDEMTIDLSNMDMNGHFHVIPDLDKFKLSVEETHKNNKEYFGKKPDLDQHKFSTQHQTNTRNEYFTQKTDLDKHKFSLPQQNKNRNEHFGGMTDLETNQNINNRQFDEISDLDRYRLSLENTEQNMYGHLDSAKDLDNYKYSLENTNKNRLGQYERIPGGDTGRASRQMFIDQKGDFGRNVERLPEIHLDREPMEHRERYHNVELGPQDYNEYINRKTNQYSNINTQIYGDKNWERFDNRNLNAQLNLKQNNNNERSNIKTDIKKWKQSRLGWEDMIEEISRREGRPQDWMHADSGGNKGQKVALNSGKDDDDNVSAIKNKKSREDLSAMKPQTTQNVNPSVSASHLGHSISIVVTIPMKNIISSMTTSGHKMTTSGHMNTNVTNVNQHMRVSSGSHERLHGGLEDHRHHGELDDQTKRVKRKTDEDQCSFQNTMPDGKDCRYYYQCVNGRLFHFFCGPNSAFDQKMNTCRSPLTSDICANLEELKQKQTPKVTKNSQTDHQPCINNEYLPDLEDCQKFYRCINGQKHPFSCPDSLIFNVNELTCDEPEQKGSCVLKEKKQFPPPQSDIGKEYDREGGVTTRFDYEQTFYERNPQSGDQPTDSPVHGSPFQKDEAGYRSRQHVVDEKRNNVHNQKLFKVGNGGLRNSDETQKRFQNQENTHNSGDPYTNKNDENGGPYTHNDENGGEPYTNYNARHHEGSPTQRHQYTGQRRKHIQSSTEDRESDWFRRQPEIPKEDKENRFYKYKKERTEQYSAHNIKQFANEREIDTPTQGYSETIFDSRRNKPPNENRHQRFQKTNKNPIPNPSRRQGLFPLQFSNDFLCPFDGYFRHSTDCTKFYHCSNGLPYLQSCHGGLVFDEEMQICDWPEKVGSCQTGTSVLHDPKGVKQNQKIEQIQQEQMEEKPLDKKQIKSNEGKGCTPFELRRHPEDCQIFYQCNSHGIEVIHKCPEELVFSVERGFCVQPNHAPECNTEILDTFVCPLPSGYFKHRYSCEQFYRCTNNYPKLLSCPSGFAFNEKIKNCDLASKIPECSASVKQKQRQIPTMQVAEYNDGTEEQKGRKLTENKGSLGFVCPEDGLFPDFTDCTRFYECHMGAFTALYCAENYAFNPDSRSCDNRDSVSWCQRNKDYDDSQEVFDGQYLQLFHRQSSLLNDQGDWMHGFVRETLHGNRDFFRRLDGVEKISKNSMEKLKKDSKLLKTHRTLEDKKLEPVEDEICVKDGRFQHASNCNRFYECKDGKLTMYQCVRGLVFNPDSSKCDHINNVAGCRTHWVEEPRYHMSNSGGKEGNKKKQDSKFTKNKEVEFVVSERFVCPSDGFFSHQSNCSLFFECMNGVANTWYCINGLVFNKKTLECDKRENVPECFRTDVTYDDVSKNGPTDPEVKAPNSCTQDGVFPDSENCQQFFMCLRGRLLSYICPQGLVFNRRNLMCNSPEYVPECYQSPQNPNTRKIVEQHQVSKETTRYKSQTQNYATTPDRGIGSPDSRECLEGEYTRDDNDCSIFYICQNSLRQKYVCASGMAFNLETTTCDWLEAVPGCKQSNE